MSENNVLTIKDLHVQFNVDEGIIHAVNGINAHVQEGQTLGIIGESGCGKSVTAHSILRLIQQPPGKITAGQILFAQKKGRNYEEVDLLSLNPKGKKIREIRGNHISMIFQEPMTSFGPLHTIGNQIGETMMIHENEISKEEARERTIRLLDDVGIPKAKERVDNYPHQFSGGMRQRAMIAMALSCSPQLLIADEPTTAVDVTIEAQILDLLRKLQTEREMSIILITHNLAVVSELADYIAVMYLGKRVEYASMEAIFENPLHPYTQGLWRSIPRLEGELKRLEPIRGVVPSPNEMPPGCYFEPRCTDSKEICRQVSPESIEVEDEHWVACHKYH